MCRRCPRLRPIWWCPWSKLTQQCPQLRQLMMPLIRTNSTMPSVEDELIMPWLSWHWQCLGQANYFLVEVELMTSWMRFSRWCPCISWAMTSWSSWRFWLRPNWWCPIWGWVNDVLVEADLTMLKLKKCRKVLILKKLWLD